MINLDYEAAREYIQDRNKFGIKPGLERVLELLRLLGNPHEKIKTIHVAGTNGKGSTSIMIAKALTANGYKVGLYTSPYLEEFEERIQIDGKNIEKAELSDMITQVSEVVSKLLSNGIDEPTEFEIITCVMFLYFYNKKVDFAVVEVGLGGRLDSTNVIKPIVSTITSISMDHMNILGNTLEEIAREKAGIIKENTPVVLYPQSEAIQRIIIDIAKDKNAQVIKVPEASVKLIDVNYVEFYQELQIKTLDDFIYDIKLPLLGVNQLLNSATAIYTLEVLISIGVALDRKIVETSLRDVTWPGRFEVMRKDPLVIIDGAHNIDAILKLKESLTRYVKYKTMYLILGILSDKEYDLMAKELTPLAKEVICLAPHSDRAESGVGLRKVVLKYNKNSIVIEDYKGAFDFGLKLCKKEDLLLICGSLHLIGDMRKIIKKD